MAADPQALKSPHWHAALRQSDDEAHRREDEWMSLNAVRALELRLAQANADRHALRQGIQLRDQLLDEQRHALAERDMLVASLQEEAQSAASLLQQATHVGPAHLLRRVVRRVRRILGRVYRKIVR